MKKNTCAPNSVFNYKYIFEQSFNSQKKKEITGGWSWSQWECSRRWAPVKWVFGPAISQTPQCVLRGSVMNSRPLAGPCDPPCLDWGGEKNAVKQRRCKRDGGQVALISDILLSWQLLKTFIVSVHLKSISGKRICTIPRQYKPKVFCLIGNRVFFCTLH